MVLKKNLVLRENVYAFFTRSLFRVEGLKVSKIFGLSRAKNFLSVS